jgi:hypothetical protein
MTDSRPGDGLFRVWSATRPPAFDEEGGRARFLERLAAPKWAAPRRFLLVAACAAAAAVAVVAWSRLLPPSFTTATGENRTGAWLSTNDAHELPITFSEGSELVMTAGSRGRVEEVRRGGASFLLERGSVRARVKHQASTSWRFLAGPFDVRVTGTTLGVDWDPARERFAVRVDEGSVAVWGPTLASPQVVHAGEQCTVDLSSRMMGIGPFGANAPPGAEASADTHADAPANARGSSDGRDAAAGSTAAARGSTSALASWTKLEAKADYEGAYAAATLQGLAALLRSSSADELLRFAQVARLSGHADAQREALLTCRRRFAGSETGAIAAYELARASRPAEAAEWLDKYLGEEPNGPLSREALGRLFEARANAGDERGAHEAAARYLARYPSGPHAALARRLLSGAKE